MEGLVFLLDRETYDEFYMDHALQLAAQAAGHTCPNPLVGAVIVRDGQVLGRGYHQKAGTPHAEIHALHQAGAAAQGATLYVTLEPCSHQGRTPPCSQAVIEAGIKRVVVAMVDPNPKVAGQGIREVQEAGISVTTGVREAAAQQLNEDFTKYITTGLPFVLLKTAMTLDGKTASRTGHAFWITGEEARTEVHRMRARYPVIMVGIGTVLADDPQLTTRLPASEEGRNPWRVIVDSTLKLPLGARVLHPDFVRQTLVATTEKSGLQHRQALEAKGAEVLVLPDLKGQVNLHSLMQELGRREFSGVLLEGGATLNASMLEAGLVDKFVAYVAPKLLGGKDSFSVIGGLGAERMDEAIMVEDLQVQKVGKDYRFSGYLDHKGWG